MILLYQARHPKAIPMTKSTVSVNGGAMPKIDRSAVMRRAWENFRETYKYPQIKFSDIGRKCFAWALRKAWEEVREAARIAAIPAQHRAKRRPSSAALRTSTTVPRGARPLPPTETKSASCNQRERLASDRGAVSTTGVLTLSDPRGTMSARRSPALALAGHATACGRRSKLKKDHARRCRGAPVACRAAPGFSSYPLQLRPRPTRAKR
jgi:hypothetical protein